MAIDKHKIFAHRLVIDFRYQSINCYRLLSIIVSSIGQAGQCLAVVMSAFSRDKTVRVKRVSVERGSTGSIFTCLVFFLIPPVNLVRKRDKSPPHQPLSKSYKAQKRN